MAAEQVATFPDAGTKDTPSTSAAAGGPSHKTATIAAGSPGSNREPTGRVGKATIKQQFKAAEAYLSTMQKNRAEASSELEEEARLFKESAFSPEQERRFRLIFHLVRSQIHTYTHNMESILQEKLGSLAKIQELIGDSDVDADLRALTIAASKGKIAEAATRIIERGLEAMHELNADSGASRRISSRRSSSNRKPAKENCGSKSAKRSRLPAAAVKEMRTWLDKHWDDPVPTHEEKVGFAQRHEITTKQVENWFINIRMREWRPAMRRALDHAEETGSYAEFTRLLQHTADGNVFKKARNRTLEPLHKLQGIVVRMRRMPCHVLALCNLDGIRVNQRLPVVRHSNDDASLTVRYFFPAQYMSDKVPM